MLFDLRGKRRRVVQVVYLSLAILMGGGLVLFGIGGDVSGGLVDAFKGGGGGGGSFNDQIERAEKRLETNPRNRPALLSLTRLHFQAANSPGNVDQSTGAYSEEGRKELQQAVSRWERYLGTKPPRPSSGTGLLAVRAYEVLGDYEQAARSQRIVVRDRPSRGAFLQLATFLYYAGSFEDGDKASQRAIARASGSERETIRKQLNLAKFGQMAVNYYVDGKVKQGDEATRKAIAQVPTNARAGMRKRLRELRKNAAEFRKQKKAEEQAGGQQPGAGTGQPTFGFPPGGGLGP